MDRVSGRELRRMYDGLGFRQTHRFLAEHMASGDISPNEFSIRDLAENLVEDGREWVETMNPRFGAGGFLEAAGAVSTTAFSNITGQIVYSMMLQEFQAEELVFSKKVPTVSTQFDGERIPGVTGIGDRAQIVAEGEAYPLAGVSEDYIDTPQTTKRGLIVPVTKEAIFFDRTNLIQQRASQVGMWLAVNKEKRLIDAFVDENTTAHRYRWRGTSYATYQASTPWVNIVASNALVDWTDVDGAEQAFANLTDPNTGEPIVVSPTEIVVTPQLANAAYRVVSATEVNVSTPGYATSGNPSLTTVRNPVGSSLFSGLYQIVSSRLLAARMATDTSWFLSNIAETVKYMENWPLTVVSAPSNNEAEFTQDVVLRFKASERGAASVHQPRASVKSTA